MVNRFEGHGSGKFILLGEHFVVHGAPAIAFPISDLRCSVEVVPSEAISFQARIDGDRPHDLEIKMIDALQRCALDFSIDLEKHPVALTSTSNFDLSRGFGSSAAFSVALMRALKGFAQHLGVDVARDLNLEEIVKSVEKTFHGNPSGVDTSTVLAGKPLRFQKQVPNLVIKNTSVDFILSDGGKRENCAPIVAEIARQKEKEPGRWTELIDRISSLVDGSVDFFKRGGTDFSVIKEAVSENQKILSDLHLTTKYIDELIEKSVALGAVCGKVSGAGRGGAVALVARKGEGKILVRKMRENRIPVVALVTADE